MQMLTEHRSQIFHILSAVSLYHCSETFYRPKVSLVFLSRSSQVPRCSLRTVYDRFIYKLFQFSIPYYQSVLYSFNYERYR
jgi:hypothetical protein